MGREWEWVLAPRRWPRSSCLCLPLVYYAGVSSRCFLVHRHLVTLGRSNAFATISKQPAPSIERQIADLGGLAATQYKH